MIDTHLKTNTLKTKEIHPAFLNRAIRHLAIYISHIGRQVRKLYRTACNTFVRHMKPSDGKHACVDRSESAYRRQPGSQWPHCPLTHPDEQNPTNSFTILESQDQEIGEFYVVQERRATDF